MQEKARKAGVVSQYTEVYCDYGAKARLDCIAIQCPAKPRYGQEACSRCAGRAAGARARRGRVGSRSATDARLGARADARSAAGGRAQQAQGARGAAGRVIRRAAGPARCALGALSLFLARFDSVLFLSQIFGHCS